MFHSKQKRQRRYARPAVPPSAHNIAWGAEQIARTIKRTLRQTRWLLECGRLSPPAYKLGGIWVADKAKLLARLSGDPV